LNRGSVAGLAHFKLTFPLWTVTRSGPGLRAFEARRGGVVVRAATLPELAQRIGEAEAAWPG
jgi:hypothetical protein